MILEADRFGDTFAFIVTGPDTDSVDVAEVGFNLRMYLWVAVYFGRRCKQDTSLANHASQ